MLYAVDLTSFMPQVESQSTGKSALEKMVWIPGGKFFMGSDRHYPEEAPAH